MAVALIVAAGRGERLGTGRPKALVTLAGRPMLEWSVQALRGVDRVRSIVIALPQTELAAAPPGTIAVAGGSQRSQSVRAALLACADGEGSAGAVDSAGGDVAEVADVAHVADVADVVDFVDGDEAVIVHDAARPLVTAELFVRALDELEASGADAVIAAMPVSDTIKEVVEGGHEVARTLERGRLWAVQTPQVFRRAALQAALEAPDEVLGSATDDAWLIERAGGTVRVVPGAAENIKVTTPVDLRMAELLLEGRAR